MMTAVIQPACHPLAEALAHDSVHVTHAISPDGAKRNVRCGLRDLVLEPW